MFSSLQQIPPHQCYFYLTKEISTLQRQFHQLLTSYIWSQNNKIHLKTPFIWTYDYIVKDISFAKQLLYDVFTGLDKSGYQVSIFLISPQKHVVGTHYKRLASDEYPQQMFS